MGICPSRCGEKQPSPEAEPAATDAALETKLSPSLLDPNHSLKRFLHLNQDPKTSATSMPRTSLVNSTKIPHSSELFSLPVSEIELRSSFALSPSEAPKRRAPRDVALKSSHFSLKSPSKGRNNNKRNRTATRGAAHQRLVDAIVRLERLSNAGKASLSGLRGSEDVAPKSSFGESHKPVRSRHVSYYHLPLQKSTMAAAQFSHPPEGNPVSLDTAPAVTDFLRETFVSLIEKPRKLEHRKGTVPATVTNRCKFEEIDGEEMFSFEFGPSENRERLQQSPDRKKSVSLQRLLQSGTQGSSGQRFASDEVAMASVELEEKSSSPIWQPVEVFVEQSGVDDRTAKARVSGREFGMKSLREEAGAVSARPAQDRNLVAMKKAKSPRLALRLKALRGLRLGRLSQSLDSIESSVINVDLEIFRSQGAKPIAANRLSTVASPKEHTTEAISIDAKRVELELLPVTSRLETPGCEQKLEREKNCCTGNSDTSTITELAAAEILPPQAIENPILSTESAESSPKEPAGTLDKVPETKEMRCEETLPSGRTECTGSEPPPPIVSKVVLQLNSGGSQWFGLVETFRSLLRLLFFFMTEQAGTECNKIATKLTTATPGPDEEIQHEWG